MPTCREIVRALDGEEIERAPFWRRLAVRFHLLMCPDCRRYAFQLRAIGDGARELLGSRDEDPERVERLREAILRRADPGDES